MQHDGEFGLLVVLDVAGLVLVHHVRLALSVVLHEYATGGRGFRHVGGPQLVDGLLVAKVLLLANR
ncbi:hypothetical protein D3C80_2226700 [compost metagenome]